MKNITILKTVELPTGAKAKVHTLAPSITIGLVGNTLTGCLLSYNSEKDFELSKPPVAKKSFIITEIDFEKSIPTQIEEYLTSNLAEIINPTPTPIVSPLSPITNSKK